MLTRRRFINATLSSGAAILSTQPIAAYANKVVNSVTQKSLGNLDQDIIQCVKKLKREREINLTILYPKGCLPNLTPIIERFSREAGIEIKASETGVDDINSTIMLKAAQNQYTFDIALPATFGIPDLVAAGALKPLDEYVARYEPTDYKQHQLYDYGDYANNQFYGYQTDGDTYLMFYNKAMLDDPGNQQIFLKQYGYPLKVPTTWKALDDMIRFFHQPEKQQYGGCLFRIPGYGAWEWWSRFHAKGYYPLADDMTPQINNAAGIEALKEMISISDFLHPNTSSDGLFENWKTFSQGNTFCNIGWGGSQKFFNNDQSLIKGNLYYAPAPGGHINNSLVSCPIFNWGWNYVVSSMSAEPEIAYLFTLFACSPVMSTLSVQQNGYFDPFRQEHYQSPEIEKIYSKDFLKAHRQSMENSIPDFYLINQSAYLSVLQENIHLAYKGSLSAKQALDITSAEWQILTNKIGLERQTQAWQELKNKYPKDLQLALR